MAIIPSEVQKIYLQSNLRLNEKTTTRDKKPYPVQRPNNSIELANWLIETLTILGVYPPGGSGTISVLTNNNNGTYTHNDGTGNSVLIDIRPSNQIGNDLVLGTDNKLFFQETLSTLQLLGSTLRYTDEDTNITDIDLSQFITLASNGLSFVAPNTIGLGGILTQLNTSIDGNGKFLNIINASISRFTANTGVFIGADDVSAQLYLYTNKVFNSIATTGQVLAYDDITKIAEYEDLGSLPVTNPTTSNIDTLQNTLDDLNTSGGADTDWVETPLYVYNNTKNIGIGTTTPTAKLDIRGDFYNVYNTNSYLLNSNVNIASLFGNPAIIGDVSMLLNTGLNSQAVVYTREGIAQLGVETANEGAAHSTIAGWALSTAYDQINKTELLITPTNLSIDGDTGATGSFTTVDGKTVTVTKGIITNIV